MNEDDFDLFRQAVSEATPLASDKADVDHPKPAPRPRQKEADDQQVLVDMLSDEYQPYVLDVDSDDVYCVNGLQKGVIRKLKRGLYSIDDDVDLHGMTISEARPYLSGFLTHASSTGAKCVRIVHGKGYRSADQQAVLKPRVKAWLIQRQDVLAFCPANARDGGTGALYVLLKKC